MGYDVPMTKSNNNSVSDEDLKFALFGGGEITDEQLNEVKNFAKFIKERDKDWMKTFTNLLNS